MSVPIKNFPMILADLKASMIVQGSRFTDLLVGSRMYAILSAMAGALAEGWLTLSDVQDVYYVTTATGIDLDRRVEDVGLRRNPGTKATGAVVAFTNSTVSIPAGTILQTGDGNTLVEVVQTRTIAAPYGTLPVIVTEVGSKGNLAAGITLKDYLNQYNTVTFKVGSQGVDNNLQPVGRLTTGTDRESDMALRSRFVDYLKSLSRATLRSVRSALLQIPGLSSLVIENAKPVPGYVTISVSDGSGTVSSTIAEAVATVMDEYAAAGIGYVLQSIARREFPVSVTAFTSDNTVAPSTIQAAVSAKIFALGQTFDLGDSLYRSEIIRSAFVDGLENLTVQLPLGDEIADPNELLGISAITVNVVYI